MTKTHADASPSSASIWINCPASVTKARGRKRVATSYSREGSAAHEIAELLVHGLPIPDEIVIEGETVEIEEEMVEAIQSYVDFLRDLRKDSDLFLTETRVRLDHLPEPIYGTADAIAYRKANKTLIVPDLKYGKGVKVEAKNNVQARIYALGALAELEGRGETPERVITVIVQPRMEGQSVDALSVADLRLWEMETLWPAAERVAKNDKTEKTGTHCRFCVRAGECQSLAKAAQVAARQSFEPVHELPSDELAAILNDAEMILDWVNKVRAEVSHRLDQGQAVMGWKLVAKRAMRRWLDEKMALKELIVTQNLPADEVTKIVSPAAAERALKTHKINPDPVLKPLVGKQSSGTTLARESDARPNALQAKNVFEAITQELSERAELSEPSEL